MAVTAFLGPLKRPWRLLRRVLPPQNFITLHYTYFVLTCLLGAVIFWGSSTPARSVSFVDSLFVVVSAMTLAGLNTVNLSSLNTFQQFMLFLLIILGSAIFVSAFVVHVRRRAFEQKFTDIYEQRQRRRQRNRRRSLSLRRTFSLPRRSEHAMSEVLDGQKAEKTRLSSESTDGEGALKTYDDMNESTFKASGSTNKGTFKASNSTNEEGVSKASGGLGMASVGPSGASQERDITALSGKSGLEMNVLPAKNGQHAESAIASDDETEPPPSPKRGAPLGITFSEDTRFRPADVSPDVPRRRHRLSFINLQGVGARPSASVEPTSPGSLRHRPSFTRSEAPIDEKHDPNRYIDTIGGWISRNSQFHGLGEKERERLGGYEYRAVVLLSWLVPAYFILWQLLGCLGCAAWVAANRPNTARENGLNPWWVGAFNAVSAFNNSGMSLLDANMTAFQTGFYLLITMGLLILAGNTCYPIFLRLIVWTMLKIVSRFEGEVWAERAATLRFLLDHPRRCYTNLFPSQHTWWLLFSVITLNGIDWAGFEILNIGNEKIDGVLPTNVRVIVGLFQAFAVRSGGFYVVSIPTVRISLQVLYVVMMYISVYPVVITMRNSNVYEERSLGIYADDVVADPPPPKPTPSAPEGSKPGLFRRARSLASSLGPLRQPSPSHESNSNFIRHQLRAQLAHDAWLIVLALFLIMIIESSKFNSDPAVYSVFNFLFEIVSAYGCVGISQGVPWDAYSFCGSWTTLSKLILCVVMIRGRHRGLPVAIDKAVLLPGAAEREGWAEEDDGRIRLSRTWSRGRTGPEV